jgi:alpha-1,3/alpha-1,6-mannosyltransferase
MASGTPVVAVREAGPAETVVDGATGFLCDREPKELGEALLRLLEDGPLRERMGQAAREHTVANFTWDRSVEQLAKVLGDAAVIKMSHTDAMLQANAMVGE